MHSSDSNQQVNGFTLLELLIVVGILGILASVVVLVLNPAEIIKRAQDGKRLSDIGSLNDSINLFKVDEGTGYGDVNTVYISIPDTSATCANLTLLSLPGGWSYACATEANLRNTDGTGWVPVDFSSISTGAPISKLPIDSANDDGGELYYSYVADSAEWELNTNLLSEQQLGKETSDGGDDPAKYEKGTNLTLAP